MHALALTGPTASGKTALSISLAQTIGAEIISCDSMQIYLGMDIGTAKATPQERAGVPHHLIDFLPPTESYSAERYRSDALACVRDITARGRIPLFVGGTGLYIDTLMRAQADGVPQSSPEYREKMMTVASREGGADALWERLREVDAESAAAIHKNNVKRVIRALEIYDTTGIPKSVLDRDSKNAPSDICVDMITLDFHNRENLYARVDKRVDIMLSEGLAEEVSSLYCAGLLPDGSTASQAIGYKELRAYVKGESSLSEAVELLKLASRRYAKRQLTWFRHEVAERIYADREDGTPKSFDELCKEVHSAAERLMTENKTRG